VNAQLGYRVGGMAAAGILAMMFVAGAASDSSRPCGHQYGEVGTREVIRFKPGETSATVQWGVMSRFRDLYDVTARKGQTLTVRITATEENAVFQICRPDGKTALAGADFGEDATHFTGQLPAGGRYTIIVGPTRQGAEYKLSVEVK
jgi:hypothetical protein